MRSKLTLFAAACVASLAMSTSASAATILSFSQQFSTDSVTASVAGTTTTLNTVGGAGSPTSIPIVIGQLGTIPNANQPAFETFLPALSSTGPTAGGEQNGFTGTILITAGTGGAGTLFLRADVVNGNLNANGAAGGFNAATGTTNGGAPTTVTLTSNFAPVIAAMGGSGATFTTTGAVSLSLVNISPPQSGGASFVSFLAQNTGNFSTVSVIPEPASFVSASTAILAGLGCFGWSRRKAFKA